ncbi:CocE/NonD family hydrolase [Gordonia jinhuaensis]|nr:CocE/NonD family hydrolase [Gordonia jinhuaensis]
MVAPLGSPTPFPRPGTRTGRTAGDLPLGDPTGGADGRRWRRLVDGPLAFPRVHIDRAVHIRMSDGVTLRATQVRPADERGHTVADTHPAIVTINPYNRALVDAVDTWRTIPAVVRGAATAPLRMIASVTGDAAQMPLTGGGIADVFGINRRLIRAGYAQLVVDVRGTGSSHGTWQILGEREQLDSVEVIDWAARQSWCNGVVGMTGWSYSAINSLQAADKRPDALGAIFAVEGCGDIVRDIYITGGMPSLFIPMWLSIVNGLKWIPDPRTLAHDLRSGHLPRWLAHRISSPATEMTSLAWGFLTGRDDRIHDDPYFDERDPHAERIEVPTFLFGAWHDLFGRSASQVYNRIPVEPGAKQLVMADGYHLDAGAGFGGPQSPPRVDVLERAWFDHWLKGIDNGVQEYGPVTLQQQGGSWSCAPAFPRPTGHTHHLYLSDTWSNSAHEGIFDGTLDDNGPERRRDLHIRPDLRGAASRDMTQVTAGASMGLGKHFTTDARFQERGGLGFTTAPMHTPTHLSGAMNLRVYVTTSANEGIWAVTVNDVAPDGTSTVLSNGALSMSNRAIDPQLSEYADDGTVLFAHHHLSRVRKLAVPSDTPLALDIDLVPTDAVIDIGHRLRVNVYAASFPRYLTTVPDLIKARGRRQHLVLDPERRSKLTVRVIGEPGW